MSELDREEAAFRQTFARHAEDVEPVTLREPRQPGRHWRAPLMVAAVVLLLVGVGVSIAGSRTDNADPAPAGDAELANARWIGIRNIEVKAPVGWPALYEPTRPDCMSGRTNDPAEPGFAKRGYVVIGVPDRIINAIGCFRKRGPDDPDEAFGELPFPLWRPYVKVVPALPDVANSDTEYSDGSWEFRGWRLTRRTYGDVQVSVLSVPGDDNLGPAVLDSARRVTVNDLGCPATSPVLDHPDLDSRLLPSPAEVTEVVICDYSRDRSEQGPGLLAGSRSLVAEAARDLTRAIQEASPSGSTGRGTCRHRTERGLVLQFNSRGGTAPASAYVYVDSCSENGIVAPGLGTRRLTRDDCAPLFDAPPIGLFLYSTITVGDACSTQAEDDQYVVPDPFE